MATATGTSVLGIQTILVAAPPPAGSFTLRTTDRTTAPALVRGYYYIYSYINTPPFKTVLVKRERFYSPGIQVRLDPAYWDPASIARLDVVWNQAGIPWEATIQ